MSTTYIEVDNASGATLRRHVQDMMGGLHIPIAPIFERLPSFYWLPKLPFRSRFIAATNQCTTKPLSSLLTSCPTTIMVHFNEYFEGIHRNTVLIAFGLYTTSTSLSTDD